MWNRTLAEVGRAAAAGRASLFGLLAVLALGGLVVAASLQGAAHRPVAGVLILLLGAAAGAVSLRYGLPIAVLLAFFHGSIVDLAGTPGRYWKEAFVGLLVGRALLRRRPTTAELAVAGLIGAVFLGHLVTGTRLLAVAWAAKILLLSVVAGWAIWRLRPQVAEWRATYRALAVAAGAGAVVAVWQRWEGVTKLARLGFPYDERLRETPTGELRAFGGFTDQKLFSYALALTALCWLGFVLSRHDRGIALATCWVPVAALVGISLSLDRIALLALSATLVALAARYMRSRAALVLLLAGPLVIGAVLAFGGHGSREFLAQGFTLDSESLRTRRAFWSEYGRDLSMFGAGPASAGSAYARVAPNRTAAALVTLVAGWHAVEQHGSEPPFRWMGTRASIVVRPASSRRRPPLTLFFDAASFAVERRLSFRLLSRSGSRVLAVRTVPATSHRFTGVSLPRGQGVAVLLLEADPPAQSASAVTVGDRRRLAIRVAGIGASEGRFDPRTPAERVFERVQRRLSASALGGSRPGVVDNLYLSWLFQYGILFGGLLCAVWVGVLLRPMAAMRGPEPLVFAARGWGLFLALAALGSNIWEQAPIDLLTAIVFAQALMLIRPRGRVT